MIKYRADLCVRRVVRVEADRETKCFVWSKRDREAKRSEFHVYKDTWEEARAELVKYVNLEIANKIAGVDTKGQDLQNKWQEIENRIQTSRESIEQSNMKAAAANADKAIEDWKMSVLDIFVSLLLMLLRSCCW